MRRSIAVVLAFCCQALAQISVDESATRAELVDGRTSIALALQNSGSTAADVRIRLRWLSPRGAIDRETWRDATLAPGSSKLTIPHPLTAKCEPLVERLQYDLYPPERNPRAFATVTGMLSFPNISDYAFTLGILTAGIPLAGQPVEARVLASHPITGRPVPGVLVRSGKAKATTDQEGIAILRIPREPEVDGPIAITGGIGDVDGTGKSTPLSSAPDNVRGYTDKPIYQPGQTMHLRILALGGDGKAKAGESYDVRISSKSEDLVHRAEVTTSRFGVAWTDWEIPQGTESGQYDIYLKMEDTDRYLLRSVNIRRYELPSFRVTANPDRPFYLSGQSAQVTVRGEYLFGKPVTSGKVRIVAADDEDTALAEGALDATGQYRFTLDTNSELEKDTKFEDRRFIALLTDLSTNRTEPRRFDIRISRDPIHIYPVRMDSDPTGRRLYITTFTPDGAALQSSIEVAFKGSVLGKGRTNRFGLARIDLPSTIGNNETGMLEIRVLGADGTRGHAEVPFANRKASVWLRTNRSIYRAGDEVRCAIGSAEPGQQVLLIASNEKSQVVYSKRLRLQDGRVEASIPYDKRFGRALDIGVVTGAQDGIATRRVYYPGPGDLVIQAAPDKATYRPGDTASIRFQTSSEAALGIAVVDQSVTERDAADRTFDRRSPLDGTQSKESNLGGITERDLLSLSPGKIDDDFQLIAEVLSPEAGPFVIQAEDSVDEITQTFTTVGATALAQVRELLDGHYLRTLEHPRDNA